VHRLLNPFGFAAGQLAVFQGTSEAPVPHHFDTGGKEPDLQERKMVRDAPSNASPARTALPTAHVECNDVTIIYKTAHYFQNSFHGKQIHLKAV